MIAFFRTVKFRLTLWYLFILAIILVIFAFLMHAELTRVLYNDADRRLEHQAYAIQTSLENSLKKYMPEMSDPTELGAQMDANYLKYLSLLQDWEKQQRHVGRSTLMIRVIDVDRKEYISNLKGWEQDIIFPDFERDSVFMEKGSSFQTIHFQNRPVRLFYQKISLSDRPVFIIQCGFSLQDVEITLRRLIVIILVWIPLALIGSSIAGWFLAKRSLSPIDTMIKKAKMITAAYLKSRLPRTETGDELDRLAGTLNDMMDRLESSTRAVQEFSTDVSHELKTPLAIIKGEIDLALRKTRTTEALIDTLRIIESEVLGLTRLVDDLMLLVRSDSHQLRLEKNRIYLRSVLEYVHARFQDRAVEKRIDLIFHCEQDCEVDGDEVYLKRLFSNLVDNALKFTAEAGFIRITLQKEGDFALIQVQDNGMGIDKSIQDKVFSRFYRSDQARPFEGSGLGLNIAKAVTDAHSGLLSLSSRTGEGTTVAVRLPLVN